MIRLGRFKTKVNGYFGKRESGVASTPLYGESVIDTV